jgi:2Fe-2S ferredoxin
MNSCVFGTNRVPQVLNLCCIAPDETEVNVPFLPGESLLRALMRAKVPGILAECGGGGACATCHVHLDPQWQHLPPPDDRELDMLSFVIDPTPDSRLACRIRLTDHCASGIVTVAERQL